ncbi:MAG: Glucose-1-phosphate cytidylyltransferase [Chlamydiae bacterium]|nr:Glucose-1-phosphate cytidylyltransferase [Chlamydiota bacterium]
MKCVILAGGLGTRLAEETDTRPKPMVEVGGHPIIWHIMKIYSYYGIHEFVICLGYKGYLIKQYFLNYYERLSDITVNLRENTTTIHNNKSEPWKITLVDTGEETMTGGRLKRIGKYLGEEDFCFTYGDGLANIDLNSLLESHKKEQCLATVTAVQPPGRFGSLDLEGNKVLSFKEKPKGDGYWINGGFFILSPKVLSLIGDDSTIWEKTPMETLAKNKQMNVYFHDGFWQPMDTLRDKLYLENLWGNKAPWKVWDKISIEKKVCL